MRSVANAACCVMSDSRDCRVNACAVVCLSMSNKLRLNTTLPGAPPLVVARSADAVVTLLSPGGNGTIVRGNINAGKAGLLHVINGVLLPPAKPAA